MKPVSVAEELGSKTPAIARTEYGHVLDQMGHTGESIWVINGAYLLAVTVILGVIGTALVGPQSPNHLALAIGSLFGLALCCLWWGSFQRNYGYYNLRIKYARYLEEIAGFSLLRLGEKLHDDHVVHLSRDKKDEARFTGPRCLHEPGIQRLTNILIGAFALLFLSSLVLPFVDGASSSGATGATVILPAATASASISPPLPPFLTFVLNALLGPGVAAALVGWIVGRSVGKEVEHLRAQLHRQSRVHEMVVQELIPFYSDLYDAHELLQLMNKSLIFEGENPDTYPRECRRKIKDAYARMTRLRLLLPEALVEKCDTFFAYFAKGESSFAISRQPDWLEGKEKAALWKEASKYAYDRIPRLLKALERSARREIHEGANHE